MGSEMINRLMLVSFLFGVVAGQCRYVPDAGTAITYRASDGVRAPVVIRQVAPLFTEEAMKAKFEGTVKVAFVVGLDGKPDRMEVTQGLGLGQDEAVIAALREWRFEPGRKGGKAVPVEADVVAVFRLRNFRHTRLAYSAPPFDPPPALRGLLLQLVGETCDPVRIGFLIPASGVATDFQILSGTNESTQVLAIELLRGWRFDPAKREGVPVPRRAEVDFSCEPWPASAR